jgi:beta-lactam-binding protein with PASTA domain
VQFGDLASIPRLYGMALADAQAALSAAGFRPAVGVAVSSTISAGLVVGTQPRSRALRGSTVVIFTSTGAAAPPPAARAPGPPQCAPNDPKCKPRGRRG